MDEFPDQSDSSNLMGGGISLDSNIELVNSVSILVYSPVLLISTVAVASVSDNSTTPDEVVEVDLLPPVVSGSPVVDQIGSGLVSSCLLLVEPCVSGFVEDDSDVPSTPVSVLLEPVVVVDSSGGLDFVVVTSDLVVLEVVVAELVKSWDSVSLESVLFVSDSEVVASNPEVMDSIGSEVVDSSDFEVVDSSDFDVVGVGSKYFVVVVHL